MGCRAPWSRGWPVVPSRTRSAPEVVETVRGAVGGRVPILLAPASGPNASELMGAADGAFVNLGWLGGDVREAVDPDRVAALLEACG